MRGIPVIIRFPRILTVKDGIIFCRFYIVKSLGWRIKA